ncbi:MAG: stage III sporulation protein AE [Ruminococcaceae bacterium]|nr:stage III sporulation protein AE [Oscillospiraceae bacterium]
MKKVIVFGIALFMLFVNAHAEEGEIIDEYISIYSSEFDDVVAEYDVDESVRSIVPEFDAEKMIRKTMSGDSIFDIKSIFTRLLSLLFGEIRNVLKIMLYVIAISILTAYLSALPDGRSKEVSDIAFFACYTVIAGICSVSYVEIVTCAKSAIDTIVLISKVVVPVVTACLMGSGAVVSASSFQPMLLSVIGIALFVIEKFFLPALMLYAIFNIVNNLSEKFNIDKMVQFVGKVIKWGISILLTIFIGCAGLQSLASSGADGISVKIAKYAASNLIPFVGGILSESVETVMNCSVVIKNAVGITGIIIMAGAMLLPLIKISACLIVLRLTSSVVQPIADNRVSKCVSGIADAVGLVFSITLAVTVMFIIIMTIMLSAGNSAYMLGR